jgi:hypothetical protein
MKFQLRTLFFTVHHANKMYYVPDELRKKHRPACALTLCDAAKGQAGDLVSDHVKIDLLLIHGSGCVFAGRVLRLNSLFG